MNWRTAFLILLAGVLLAACAPATPRQPATVNPTGLFYVVSGQNAGTGFSSNALTAVKRDGFQKVFSRKIRRSWAKRPAIDPERRIWIGYSGDMNHSDNRVDIFSPNGDLLTTLHPCGDPEAGISFSHGRAFVACAEDGFKGEVAVVDLKSLKVEKTVVLTNPGSVYLLISSAADDKNVVVSGATEGPNPNFPYARISIISPESLAVTTQINLGINTDIWDILPYNGDFLLLNVASARSPKDKPNDILWLAPGNPPTIHPVAASPSPFRGALVKHVLYSYHDPSYNSTSEDPRRWLSSYDLDSHKLKTMPLPDKFGAYDIAWVNGKLILAAQKGIYEVNWGEGAHLLLRIPDASSILERSP